MSKGKRMRAQRQIKGTSARQARAARQQIRNLNAILEANNAGIVSGQGIYQATDRDRMSKSFESLYQELAPGQHLWMMVASYHVPDPAKLFDPEHTAHFDMENLIASELGCYKCEQGYTHEIASKPCVEVP